jgi:beta-amylase
VYDRYMLSVLRAAAQQVSQPSWGHGGPHDAGGYRSDPNTTGFFAPHGSWSEWPRLVWHLGP